MDFIEDVLNHLGLKARIRRGTLAAIVHPKFGDDQPHEECEAIFEDAVREFSKLKDVRVRQNGDCITVECVPPALKAAYYAIDMCWGDAKHTGGLTDADIDKFVTGVVFDEENDLVVIPKAFKMGWARAEGSAEAMLSALFFGMWDARTKRQEILGY